MWLNKLDDRFEAMMLTISLIRPQMRKAPTEGPYRGTQEIVM